MKNSGTHTTGTGGKGLGIKPKDGSPETTDRVGSGGNQARPKLIKR